ncbi:hypothetical protein AC579_8854 [Pseudocercospora musae]|uniref:Uncharacterized protein n=1 Tax=Pseudocercospora musae TaxID=113226 RepID=A0A139IH10_9PEZI|nr:hypothetical protein AC579_8854 [Pseudocercospora musae]
MRAECAEVDLVARARHVNDECHMSGTLAGWEACIQLERDGHLGPRPRPLTQKWHRPFLALIPTSLQREIYYLLMTSAVSTKQSAAATVTTLLTKPVKIDIE